MFLVDDVGMKIIVLSKSYLWFYSFKDLALSATKLGWLLLPTDLF
jgi:hypothetical protein